MKELKSCFPEHENCPQPWLKHEIGELFKNGSLQGQACGNCEESSDSIMNKDIGAAMTNVAIVATASSASLAFLSCKKDGDNESHALLLQEYHVT